MKITFLGTGAADFLPSLADSDRFTVSRDIRRCTVTQLGEDTLIDCGPHLTDELKLHGISADQIKNILVTHLHGDHFCPSELKKLQAARGGTLHVWHNEAEQMPPVDGVVYHPMQMFRPYAAGALTVTPLPANHVRNAVHYSIEGDGKRLFYGCDGAWFLTETFAYMMGRNYDAMILDATVGDYTGDYRLAEHNSIPMLRLMLPSFRTCKIAGPHTKLILDHLARTLHKSHAETCALVERDGFVVAYDGMTLEV